MGALAGVPLSVLDRSRTRIGETEAETLRATVELAQQVEKLGYRRFWVSEHHSVPGVVGSAPTVLAAAVAARTEHIRVGTGGVMLPNHQPLVVAEQFGVLESLYPGRIDMGLGRSVGFTNGIRRALGVEKDAAADFADQLRELLGYFDGTQQTHPQVHARPGEGLRIPAFVLAIGSGASLAASFGLPLVIAGVKGETDLLELVESYRADFQPSAWGARPYVVLAATAAVAPTTEQARELLLPEAWASAYSRTQGVFPPLDSTPPASMTPKQRELFEGALTGQIYGTPAEVDVALGGLVRRTGADEVLITTNTFDRGDLVASYTALAELTSG
ncbi:MsnO8 family LLM class oxidoreductase [Kribbella sandramycini]|uniref:Luciferase family oxidoreductase group 1 n=1 Tax=Kribbella sandramycini TaxID=60450 RepID=A0A7Y4L3K2_9ACTN|nr:MsnO8 family LLM class oxidoreductase [Kribbella sandramycini]MBB6570544.1 luciferase family oxidoreductase group 1 [Kribbella sandramycini]NOL43690.1 MsnO8 family LLM class oxidoreductase [Kribbella sandramycini]